jgi:hypothetical protein
MFLIKKQKHSEGVAQVEEGLEFKLQYCKKKKKKKKTFFFK